MSTLKIAVQKSGRLNDESMKLLKDIGISIDNGKDQLKAVSRNFPVEVFYLRNGDIVYPIHRFLENSTTMEYPHPDETEKVFLAGYSITSLNKYINNKSKNYKKAKSRNNASFSISKINSSRMYKNFYNSRRITRNLG